MFATSVDFAAVVTGIVVLGLLGGALGLLERFLGR
jgi:hypothetical protein